MIFRKEYDRTEKLIIGAIYILIALFIVCVCMLTIGYVRERFVQPANLEEERITVAQNPLTFGDDDGYEAAQSGASIELRATAGYVFYADREEQDVDFINFAENPCALVGAVYLGDGTEVLRTGMLFPGDAVTKMKLSTELKPGVYRNALMVYEIYAISGEGAMQNRCEFPIEITYIE